MLTLCFYQDSRHELPLYWIKKILQAGYISKRNDGITELRINGFKQVKSIIKELLPYIKFKKSQAKEMYQASCILADKKIGELSKTDLLKLVDNIVNIQKENYATKSKKSKEEILKILGLTP